MTAFFRLFAALAALSIVSALAAQSPSPCPKQQARTVAERFTLGPIVGCGGGLTLQWGGVTISHTASGCPLIVIFYPEHEQPEPASSNTYVHWRGTSDVMTFMFECRKEWILIIPIGSYCAHVKQTVSGVVNRYSTLPCTDDRNGS